MEQRPLRLGDLVDDYCPRERRVTNHAIVAIVNDSIRQTRCTACDTEHVFKGGKAPRRRPKDAGEPPVDNTGGQLVTPSRADEDASVPAAPNDIPAPEQPEQPEQIVPMSADGAAEPAAAVSPQPAPEPEQEPIDDRPDVVWPANRQLIRATLPRAEGDVPPPRPIPEFTMHQRYSGRGAGAFRQARAWADQGFGSARGGNGNGNGNGNGSRDRRPGQGQGQGFGPGPGQGQGRRRHGKKRPR
jgi:hypothetical protein